MAEHGTDKASEAQLREYDREGVITAAKILREPDGYVLVIRLTWKTNNVVLYNYRDRPRTWASLDRMLAHLAEVAPSIKVLELVLQQ